MQRQIPLTRDIVLVGGGHAHALVLRMWGMKPLPGVRLTVVDPRPVAPYTGMLPGHVAGHYSADEIGIDLVRLCRFAGARLIIGAAGGLDPVNRVLSVGDRRIGYDLLSLDIGITGDLPQVPGFDRHGTPVKPFVRFAAGWEAFVTKGQGPAVVIGNGLGGVELALAMARRLGPKNGPGRVSVVGGERVAQVGAALNRVLLRQLQGLGVALVPGRVVGVEGGAVHLADGQTLPSAFTVGAAGATPQPWLEDTGLPLSDGFIRTGADLQVEGHPGHFAAGDCAHLVASPRPKAGVFAVRAAKVLFHNLRAAAMDKPLRSFRPQKHFLRLVSLGDRTAVAEKWPALPLAPTGRLIWRWKDRIDRRFMSRLTDPPSMVAGNSGEVAAGVQEILGQAPLCAGCGSKVGPGVLHQVLSGMDRPARTDVISGPGDDAGVLEIGGRRQVLTTDHLRAFTEDPGLMARIAAQHALGDVRAMGADPQSALVQVILPRASDAIQARMMEEIMQAAGDVFHAAGAVILGGHSTMGAELTIGFTVTGLCDAPITLGGARPGDALILTGRIGSGVVLAGEMQGKARGADVVQLWQRMESGPGDVAALRGARAMTDVTGFGLAGHLMAICRASGTGARLDLTQIPLHPGALDLSEKGVRSTLYPANRVHAPVFGPEDSRTALLHDPQTAGGFLAAVAPDQAEAVLADLRAAGVEANRIGDLTEGPVGITVSTSPT